MHVPSTHEHICPTYLSDIQGTFGKVKEWIALIILVLVLLGLAFEVAHRTWVSFAGSFAMLGE